ncbi:urea amidolyase family protein [Phyllobacterium sp. UNC302MFCol5.2]|uniref:5-oxoprolinase subunit B/C family protein n=1 Tax=Phyllobacterium sp. UNC302MFCol5.2 TaxID=1449065 RepID=UPI0004848332|nr:urea amidolyase family protein [Phyllobacterium sp. UNC302MFCol5.2]
MLEFLRFLPAGTAAMLLELPNLEATITLLDALQTRPVPGVVEIVPAARTLLIRFDAFETDRSALIDAISKIDLSVRSIRQGKLFEIPVVYDGEDLNEVGDLLGWSVDNLIDRHTAATYTVAFTGFAPGFAYMACDDPAFDVPRRKSPRARIPAGAVALGGKFGGIYPSEGPGGWQLLGRTPLKMWDVGRSPAALLAPGDRVQFRNVTSEAAVLSPKEIFGVETVTRKLSAEGLLITRADRPALYQDRGRLKQARQGVSESGALDRKSFIEANLCVGNPRGATVVEIAYGGFALKTDRPVTLALCGATTPATIRTNSGKSVYAPIGQPFALDAGDEVTLEFPPEGTRTYLAIRGGFKVENVLNSAASDTLAKVGPPPISVGDVLVPALEVVSAVDPYLMKSNRLPTADEVVSLDIVLGPRTDWFAAAGVSTLTTQQWQVTQDSSRVGVRLAGEKPIQRSDSAELPSEGTPLGAIQVPHDGQPILFLADHPLTGGYPVIGVVADHHLDLAGQVPIGAKIRFNVIAAFDPSTTETER